MKEVNAFAAVEYKHYDLISKNRKIRTDRDDSKLQKDSSLVDVLNKKNTISHVELM